MQLQPLPGHFLPPFPPSPQLVSGGAGCRRRQPVLHRKAGTGPTPSLPYTSHNLLQHPSSHPPPSTSVQVAQAAGVVTLSSPTKQGQPGTPGRGPAGTAAAAGGQGTGGAAAGDEEDEDALVDPVDEVRV